MSWADTFFQFFYRVVQSQTFNVITYGSKFERKVRLCSDNDHPCTVLFSSSTNVATIFIAEIQYCLTLTVVRRFG